jgi:hypothetical protein
MNAVHIKFHKNQSVSDILSSQLSQEDRQIYSAQIFRKVFPKNSENNL